MVLPAFDNPIADAGGESCHGRSSHAMPTRVRHRNRSRPDKSVRIHRGPQPLDQHIVQSSSTSIHTGADGLVLERLQELAGSEWRALVGVEDLAPARKA